ncbi:hypothetical protein Ancab_029394 [Ancistrocladus abbreviatus]
MNEHHFAREIFKPPSGNGHGALQHPPPLPETHKLQRGLPFHDEFPPYKRSRIGETIPNLRTPGYRNKEITNFMHCIQDWRNFKTLGKCNYGDNCKFFHGYDDARRFPRDRNNSVGDKETAGSGNFDCRIDSGIRRCRKFQGREGCPYGERCIFLHEGSVKSKAMIGLKGTNVIGIKTSTCEDPCLNTDSPSSLNTSRLSSKQFALKTRLCNKWALHRSCPYGSTCFFAHGQEELQKTLSLAAPESGNVGCSTRSTLAEDRLLSKTETRNTYHPQALEKKWSFKLERQGKIIGIYADWIEEKHVMDAA